jgi:hypothetical protein
MRLTISLLSWNLLSRKKRQTIKKLRNICSKPASLAELLHAVLTKHGQNN